MYKYQNISKNTLTITTSGNVKPRVVQAGETVETDFPLENPNFKYVGNTDNVANDVTAAEQSATQTEKENQ
jgi:hypothetical protein